MWMRERATKRHHGQLLARCHQPILLFPFGEQPIGLHDSPNSWNNPCSNRERTYPFARRTSSQRIPQQNIKKWFMPPYEAFVHHESPQTTTLAVVQYFLLMHPKKINLKSPLHIVDGEIRTYDLPIGKAVLMPQELCTVGRHEPIKND